MRDLRRRRSRRLLARVVALLAVFATVLLPRLRPPSAQERAGWAADHERLRTHVATAYANFLERTASRHLDLPALDRATRQRIAAARSREDARAALQDLVAAFDDAHFRARAPYPAWRRWLRRAAGKDRPANVEPIPYETSGESACERMGYARHDGGPLDWSAVDGWRPLPGDRAGHPFVAGTVARGAVTAGVLRIPFFGGQVLPELCAATWREQFGTASGSCDADCQGSFAWEVERAIGERLAGEAEALAKAGATLLVVDLTGNGGGSSVADPLARTLTAVPLRRPPVGFVRHPHWAKRFAAMAEEMTGDLAKPSLTPAQRTIVGDALAAARRSQAEAETPCDLSSLWTAGAAPPPCSNVARTDAFLRYAAPGSLEGVDSRGWIFEPSQYGYREGAWRGPLVVLVDGDTASAAEEFTAILRDNGAARVAGAPTLGIGCGFTDGGITLELPATGLTVRAPDCVRYRADGSTEAAPIRPDLPVAWRDGDGAGERAEAALAAILAGR